MTRPSDAHVRAMPKVELHVHIEGAARASTVAELARRHGIDLGVDDPAELYRYRDLADFLRVFVIVCRCLRTADDIHRVAYEAMAIAAAAGVRYREVMCSPSFVMRHGVSFATIWTGLAAGLRDAETDHGIVGRVIVDVHKPAGAAPPPSSSSWPRRATGTCWSASAATAARRASIWPRSGRFRIGPPAWTAYDDAPRRGGAGGDVGIGLDAIGVERIDHGVSVVQDPVLLARVVAERHPVDRVPDVQRRHRHRRVGRRPSRRELLAAGAHVTINSDNAAMFGVDAADELVAVRDALDLDVGGGGGAVPRRRGCGMAGRRRPANLRAAFETELAALR